MSEFLVQLCYHEIIGAAMAGVLRQLENLRDGRQHAHNMKNSDAHDWQMHIEGCLGEMAFAKATNRYWCKGRFRGDDVGEFQIRTSRRDNSDLILHPSDADTKQFYLLTGYNGNYKIRGWIFARDGKHEKYWRDPAGGRPAFFVPQSVLNPYEK